MMVMLAVDRTRLFRGLSPGYGPPPPYESVHTEGQFVMGKNTCEVMKDYLQDGYSLPQGWWDMPDYVGIELDFLGHLYQREALAWQEAGREDASYWEDRQRYFLQEHAMKWMPDLCDVVIKEAATDFYKAVAEITKAFVILEVQRQFESKQV